MAEDLSGGVGGVTKRVLRPAPDTAIDCPPQGASVTVHYDGYLLNGTKFDSSRDRGAPFVFKLGVGQVIQAWDLGVAAMRKGELAQIQCRSDYGYGWEGSPPKIPGDSSLRFEVELLSWEEAQKEVADMTTEEKLAHAQQQKERGTAAFKEANFADAAKRYSGGVECVMAMPAEARAEEVPRTLLISCLLNEAQCYLKLEQWERATVCCGLVLKLEPQHAKALYRRGVANTQLEQWEEAKADLKQACLLEPKSREMREQWERTKAAAAAQKQADRAAFGGMFAKE